MPLRWGGVWLGASSQVGPCWKPRWFALVAAALWLGVASAMSIERIAELRQETVSMFYHGFDNYMDIAFPEDEVGCRVRNLYLSQADIYI